MPVITTVSIGLRKFLDLIAWSEGTSQNRLTINKGYDVIVSGPSGPEIFSDYATHPFEHRSPKLVRPGLYSTASGRYQVLRGNFDVYQKQLKLADFGPLAQDQIALELLHERKIDELLAGGKLEQAIGAASSVWASFPGNEYKQGGRSMNSLLNKWGGMNV